MADKILFDQPLKVTFGTSDRIAIGTPSQDGCDNMLVSQFLNLVKNEGVVSNQFTNGDLIDDKLTINHGKLTTAVVLTVYNNDMRLEDLSGMLQITDDSNVVIDFGGDIAGIWFYILQYWII